MVLYDKVLPFEVKNISFSDHNPRASWQLQAYKRKWYEWIDLFLGFRKNPVTCKVKGTFIRMMAGKQRPFAPTNLRGSMSPIRTQLQRNGWIKKNHKKWLDAVYYQQKSSLGEPGLRIILEIPNESIKS